MTQTSQPVESKASRTAGLAALQFHGRPAWTPRDYLALAREGYMRNPVVYRAIRMVCEAAASVPILLYEGRVELDDHPALALLDHPNPAMSRAAFFDALYGHLMAAGNAYSEIVLYDNEPRELHILRPDRMKVVPGTQGWPEAFEYSTNGQTVRYRVPPDGRFSPVLHMKMFHPSNDHYGFPPIEAALHSLDMHNSSSDWNKALLDNAARPSGALVYAAKEGGNLSDEAFDRLKTELEEGYAGARNAGRPMLLEGGLDWKQIGMSPKDMDFIGARNQAAREIALALGVPPMLLGIPGDNTYANYKEANLSFWRQTVLPLVGRSLQSVSQWLSPYYGHELRFWYDADQVEALNSEREALWNRVGNATFLSDDEKREAVGYGPRNQDEIHSPSDG